MPSQQDSIQKLNKHRTTTKRARGISGTLSGDDMGGLNPQRTQNWDEIRAEIIKLHANSFQVMPIPRVSNQSLEDTSTNASDEEIYCCHLNVNINEMIQDPSSGFSAVFTAQRGNDSHGSGPTRMFPSVQVLTQKIRGFPNTSCVMDSYSNTATALEVSAISQFKNST